MEEATAILPRRSLIALCGPAGAGKSTFASDVARRNHLATTATVSSDTCRLMLCDEIGSLTAAQWAILQPNTFQLFLTVIGMRLSIGRPTLADGVNLHRELRAGLLGHAQTHAFHTTLVVFDIAAETCLAQNAQRPAWHQIPEWQIRSQRQLLDDLLPRLPEEAWDQIIVLNDRRRIQPIRLED